MLKQIYAITRMNLASLPNRWGTSMVIVVGIAGVVAVFISLLAVVQGFNDTMNRNGTSDRAIVLRGGSQAELSSTLTREETLMIMSAPGVAKDATGKAIASADMVAIAELPLRASGTGANLTLRGVGSQYAALHPEMAIIQGRMFTPGLRELIIGQSATKEFAGTEIGSHLRLHDSDWTIVGIFATNDSHGSELLADADTVLATYRRNLMQSVTVRLNAPHAFDEFKEFLEHSPQLAIEALLEPEYFHRISDQLGKTLTALAYLVGSIMALGALFGALNSMYSAVSARTVEIATLRAIGFGALPVLLSVFVEVLLLSLAGAIIGTALTYQFFNNSVANSLSGNFTQVAFQLKVTPALAVLGIVWAMTIGFIGGLFPGFRAIQRPITHALKGE